VLEHGTHTPDSKGSNRKLWYTQSPHRIEDSDSLDRDVASRKASFLELWYIVVCTEPGPVDRPTVRAVLGLVVRIQLELPILEYRIERVQAFPREEADSIDQAADASCCECSTREADEEYLVSLFIILSNS